MYLHFILSQLTPVIENERNCNIFAFAVQRQLCLTNTGLMTTFNWLVGKQDIKRRDPWLTHVIAAYNILEIFTKEEASV